MRELYEIRDESGVIAVTASKDTAFGIVAAIEGCYAQDQDGFRWGRLEDKMLSSLS